MHPRTKYLLLIVIGSIVIAGGIALFVAALVVFAGKVGKIFTAALGIAVALAGVWPFAEGMDLWHAARRDAAFHQQFG